MSKSFELNIITSNNTIIKEEIVSLISETKDGKLEILCNFANSIISTIPTDTIYTKSDGRKYKVFTSSGIIYINNNSAKFCCDYIKMD